MHWSADSERADGIPQSGMPEQQGEVARHRGQQRRTQREGLEGGQERTGGGAHRGDVQHDSLKGTAWDPAGSFSGDDDTRERQRRETVTATRERRYLRKGSREGGSMGGAVATALDATEDW